jgi:hypothetical protein
MIEDVSVACTGLEKVMGRMRRNPSSFSSPNKSTASRLLNSIVVISQWCEGRGLKVDMEDSD